MSRTFTRSSSLPPTLVNVPSSKKTEKLCLERTAHVANLIQENGPAVSFLHASQLLSDSTGEGSFLVTKQHFSAVMKKQLKGLSPAAQQKLLAHHWPGNVRELRNVIERAVILESSHEIQARNLPDFAIESGLKKPETIHALPGQSLDDAMSHFERELIMQTLEHNRFSVSRAAEQLKISRHALRYRMQRLNINAPSDTEEEPAQPA